jgi:hypothetical protein
MRNREDCRHEVIGFQSGDYYVFCRGCPARWAAIDPVKGDVIDPSQSNKGFGQQLSGEDRFKFTPRGKDI